jgi:hypothetical protein
VDRSSEGPSRSPGSRFSEGGGVADEADRLGSASCCDPAWPAWTAWRSLLLRLLAAPAMLKEINCGQVDFLGHSTLICILLSANVSLCQKEEPRRDVEHKPKGN